MSFDMEQPAKCSKVIDRVCGIDDGPTSFRHYIFPKNLGPKTGRGQCSAKMIYLILLEG